MTHQSFGFRLGLFTIIGGIFAFSAFYAFAQTPSGKLTRQEIPRPNPLRANQSAAAPGVIKQTAVQAEDAQFPPLANGNDLPQPVAPTIPTPAASGSDPFGAPVSPFELSPALPQPAAPSPLTASPATGSPLNSADPFAPRQP